MNKHYQLFVKGWVFLLILSLICFALNVYEPHWRYWYLSLFSGMASLGLVIVAFLILSIREVVNAVKRFTKGEKIILLD